MNPAVFAGILALLFAGRSRQRTQAPVTSGALIALVVWIFVAPLWLREILILWRSLGEAAWGEAGVAALLVALTTPVLFPWWVTRTLLIPSGRVRLAYYACRMSFWQWRGDVRGGAVIAACLALLRRGGAASGDHAEASELSTWLEQKRDAASPPQNPVRWKSGGAAIVATGLLAAARGQREQARRLLASASELVIESSPRRAITIANEWLCGEAIERGDWRQVEFVARTSPVDSRLLGLLAALGARVSGIAPLPNDLVVRVRWLVAPRRRATWPLVAAALAEPPTLRRRARTHAPLQVPAAAAAASPLVDALALHAALLRRPPTTLAPEQLVQVGEAWDLALARDTLDRHLRERALVLATQPERALHSLIADVERDFTELVRKAKLSAAKLERKDEGLLARVVRRLHRELLDELEVAVQAFESRVDARRALPAMDEWQSFLALREQHAELVALGGAELRRLAFTQLHGPVCSLAVWLWNERSERALGNAMFQWLLNEAIIVDDAEAVRLQEKNVACGI
jgi:hypothetical protein